MWHESHPRPQNSLNDWKAVKWMDGFDFISKAKLRRKNFFASMLEKGSQRINSTSVSVTKDGEILNHSIIKV